MNKKKVPGTVHVSLYLPPDIHSALVALSDKNKRSANQEAVSILRSYFARQNAQNLDPRSILDQFVTDMQQSLDKLP